MDDTVKPDPALIERMVRERVDAILDERLEAKLAALRESKPASMTIIATDRTTWTCPECRKRRGRARREADIAARARIEGRTRDV